MFFFGLFSTHIPYIILTVLYLLGYGAYSINSVREKIADNIQNEKVIEYSPKVNSGDLAQNNSYYFHKNYQKLFKSISFSIQKQITVHFFAVKYKFVKELTKGYSLHLIYSLFSRPPPIG
jgi:hypothetical protein